MAANSILKLLLVVFLIPFAFAVVIISIALFALALAGIRVDNAVFGKTIKSFKKNRPSVINHKGTSIFPNEFLVGLN